MLVQYIERVQNPLLKSFLFRFYNVFKSLIIPAVLILVYKELQANPNDLSCLLAPEFWNEVVYAVVIIVLGASVAGMEKVSRDSSLG